VTIPAVAAPDPATLVEQFESESRTRQLHGRTALAVRALALIVGLSATVWVFVPLAALPYRAWFLLGMLILAFCVYPSSGNARSDVHHIDVLLIVASVAACLPPLLDPGFAYRAAEPTPVDIVLAVVLVITVLEATRRAIGHVLPWTAVAFLFYAWLGPLFDLAGLELLAHRGYDVGRLAGSLYMTLEGIFGIPLDVASTYIVLFAIFAAVLERSGTGRFLVDWALACVGRTGGTRGTSRATISAGFLLGSVSGSGVATAVSLGAVAWPMLRSGGMAAERGAAILAASGIGAVLSPPTLGAAAFLIAEYLRIPYVQVLAMAVVPAMLYYLAVLLMVEWGSSGTARDPGEAPIQGASALARQGWHHFLSLGAIVVLLLSGITAVRAVTYATIIAVLLSWRSRSNRMTPGRLAGALSDGARGIVAIAATTATAGIIVGVMTLTGLGLRVAGLITDLAGGHVALTILFSAAAVLLLGLAVPITASYIIAAVTVAPALILVGVPDFAAHMFVFYYAVLSEVSPPTALAPFAAAAVTGADPWRATMLTWLYTLPAFIVPVAFTLSPDGAGLLLRGGVANAAMVIVSAATGVAAIAAGITGGPRRSPLLPGRITAVFSGLLLIHPSGSSDAAGLVAGIVAAFLLMREPLATRA
jgi:TRAP transporter 4TM/12TM fusion protein